MVRSRTRYDGYQEASLSQKASFRHKKLRKYVGTDPDLSLKLATLNVLGEQSIIDLKTPIIKLAMSLLDEWRIVKMVTSERFNEISKLGFLLPKDVEEEDWSK